MDTKVCGKCGEEKKLDGFNKSKRYGHQSKCKTCEKEYRLVNAERIKKYRAKYYTANSEKSKEYQVEYRTANSEKVKENAAEYYVENLEKFKVYYLTNSKRINFQNAEYRVANLDKGRNYNSRRRAAKLRAIPAWLTPKDYQVMNAIYKEANRITQETGIKYHVDHIHPLQGKLICGFHCPDNLQIITESENLRKKNRFTPYIERD